MHLIYVTTSLPYSSQETWIVPEILELQRRGHRITVVPVRPGRAVIHKDAEHLIEFTIAEPILSLSILYNTFIEIVRSPVLSYRAALLLAASRNVWVFLKNLAVYPKGLWLARIAREQGITHIHAHFASTNATVALVASLFSGIPWSFTAHRWDISENNLLRKKAQASRFVRAINARGSQELRTYVGEYQHKVRVIHMGVAALPLHTDGERKPQQPLRVLVGARFDEQKGHRYALEAVAQLRRVGVKISLCCAGNGPLKVKMESYAKALGLSDCVHFPGWIDHKELLKQLHERRWDIALLSSLETSKDYEGIPVFLMEAMAAGVPVIATTTGGISELLDGGAGVLIPQQNAISIADALTRLAFDHALWHQLSDAGIRRVRDQFSTESTVSALLDEISSSS
ncbi:MAG: hypothetical protein A4E19_21280 [Nitrospira sp. SG-bin1]|nr:MAG: hypothetical protein A4E19_21280 [Nitrospira sp. SG-bin1]